MHSLSGRSFSRSPNRIHMAYIVLLFRDYRCLLMLMPPPPPPTMVTVNGTTRTCDSNFRLDSFQPRNSNVFNLRIQSKIRFRRCFGHTAHTQRGLQYAFLGCRWPTTTETTTATKTTADINSNARTRPKFQLCAAEANACVATPYRLTVHENCSLLHSDRTRTRTVGREKYTHGNGDG